MKYFWKNLTEDESIRIISSWDWGPTNPRNQTGFSERDSELSERAYFGVLCYGDPEDTGKINKFTELLLFLEIRRTLQIFEDETKNYFMYHTLVEIKLFKTIDQVTQITGYQGRFQGVGSDTFEQMVDNEELRTRICVFDAFNFFSEKVKSQEFFMERLALIGPFVRENTSEFNSSIIHARIKSLFGILSKNQKEDLMVELDRVMET